ncbi:hypothetical protein [uncultured Acinetobacter sp.]|nr:hypothetical protein [uncultured Acinetobacter sp.]
MKSFLNVKTCNRTSALIVVAQHHQSAVYQQNNQLTPISSAFSYTPHQ